MGRALPFVLILLFAIAAVFSLSVSYLMWKDVQHFNSTQTSSISMNRVIRASPFTHQLANPNDENPKVIVLKAKRAQAALQHNASVGLLADTKAENNEEACFTLLPTETQILPYKHHLAVLDGRTHNLFLFSGVPAQLATQGHDTVVSQDFNGANLKTVLSNTPREDALRIIGLCFQAA
jgi:hypothetical protein